MSWHNKRRGGPPPERACLGDSHVDAACARITQYAMVEAATMVSYTHTVDQTIAMLFKDELVRRAAQGMGLVEASHDIHNYNLGDDLLLCIDHTAAHSLPIEAMHVQTNPERIVPLNAVIHEIRAIHEKYEEVKALLRWFNRHGTAGAVRAYWPTVLQLCPGCPALADMQHVPTRYAEPPDISDRLQMIRDTATAVAGALLQPRGTKPRARGMMWLTFSTYTVQRGSIAFRTDSLTYNL